MAETSYNLSGSPISNLAQDHLLTILLYLPIDSLVSFSMTCKKFRSLASSDTLWEAICRRDWGNKSVEAFKSSNQYHTLPWMRLYRHLWQLEPVFCRKLSDPDAGLVLPNPRASHSLNFVSDCLVLFGGGCEGGRHLDDTWVAYIGNDFRRMLTWNKVSSGIPSGRFGHTCVVIGDYLVLFGGINDSGNRHNDTWVGQVACHDENLGITLSWRLLDVGGPIAPPPPRGAHSACYIDNRKMVIHGGIGLHGKRLGDTWVLELSENFCFGTWHEVVSHPSPPARSGHSLTYIGGNRAVLFGGRGLGYDVLNDVWFLDVSTSSLKWVQVLYDIQNIPGGVTLPRVGHSATLILGGRLLICGGEDSDRHRKDDFWMLDTNAAQSTRMQQATLRLSRKIWKRLIAEGYKPNCRSFHDACADCSGRFLYLFGGMVDGLVQPAEPPGMTFDGELFFVDLMPWL